MGDILYPGYLYWDGLKYTTNPGTSGFSAPAGQDLAGIYPNPYVIGLQGYPVADIAPTIDQVLKWDGASWTPSNVSASFAASGDLRGDSSSQIVIGIQGNPVLSQSLG